MAMAEVVKEYREKEWKKGDARVKRCGLGYKGP
jgi:hypothetical protein